MKVSRITGLLVLGLAVALIGCNAGKDDEFKTQEKDVDVKEAELHPHGPHGGHVADLGENHEYRVEITFSKDPRALTAYVLAHETDDAVPLAAPMATFELHGEGTPQPLTLSAEPTDDDPEGKSSRFVVKGDAIPASIDDLEQIHGHLKVEVDGKTLEADFEEESEEEHDHGKDHDH